MIIFCSDLDGRICWAPGWHSVVYFSRFDALDGLWHELEMDIITQVMK